MERIKDSIKVINFDRKPRNKRVIPMYPNIIRAALIGPSGSGKNNVLLTILLHVRPFYNVYLCSKTAFQDKYNLLDELIEGNNKSEKKKKIHFHRLSEVDKLPTPEHVEKDSIIIFDDILTENQDKIANFFLRGRHRDISCFYLTQSYTKIPKRSGIRENFNYLILFKQDDVNLRQIYTEQIWGGTDFKKFKEMCSLSWKEPYGFLVVDIESGEFKKKFELKYT